MELTVIHNHLKIYYLHCLYNTIESNKSIYNDTRCYFNVRSKAKTSQLDLPHGTDN